MASSGVPPAIQIVESSDTCPCICYHSRMLPQQVNDSAVNDCHPNIVVIRVPIKMPLVEDVYELCVGIKKEDVNKICKTIEQQFFLMHIIRSRFMTLYSQLLPVFFDHPFSHQSSFSTVLRKMFTLDTDGFIFDCCFKSSVYEATKEFPVDIDRIISIYNEYMALSEQ